MNVIFRLPPFAKTAPQLSAALFACLSLSLVTCPGSVVTYTTDENTAFADAITQNRLILLLSGKVSCSQCSAMESEITLGGTEANGIVNEAYVYWYCAQDPGSACQSYQYYASPGYSLPLMCLVDPTDPKYEYLYRSFGGEGPSTFPTTLRTGLLLGSSPVVTNLDFQAGSTVGGHTRWASLLVGLGGSVNCQVDASGWARGRITQMTNWSFTLPSDLDAGISHTLQVFFTFNGGRGKTNTISFNLGTIAAVPATVSISPANDSIVASGSAQLTASLSVGSPAMTPPFNYQWQFCPANLLATPVPAPGAYVDLTNSEGHIYGAANSTSSTNTVLSIIWADTNFDMGYYRVVATNSLGSTVISDPAMLTVTGVCSHGSAVVRAVTAGATAQPKSLTPVLTPQDQTVHLGSSATFLVRADNPPSLTYKWYKDGELLYDPDHYAGTNENELTITDAGTNQAGQYSVDVSAPCLLNPDKVLVGTLTINTNGTNVQTITFDALPPKTYGDAEFALAATADSGLPVSYTNDNPKVATISGTNVTIVGAGSTVITASQGGNSTYGAATPVSRTLAVTKATLTVKADDKAKTYGAANPPLTATITGFTNSDTQASAVTGSPALATAAAASGAGSYPITARQGTLAAANYSFTFVNGTLTVNQASLTVTADNKSRPYGAANPTLTATITGFTNGDTRASAVTGSPGLSTTATATNVAGTYPIIVTQGSLAAANYSFGSFVNGTLTVTTNDTVAPSLVIASHVDLQEVTTSRITLSGTASDAGLGDNGIKSVTVNGAPAANDTASSNNVANWSLGLNLLAGTNTLKVVATDNAPAHNAVTNVIRIISDTARPTCLIASPLLNQRWSNAVFTVRGTARDNRQVAAVWVQTNGVWGEAATGNGWTNWTIDVALVPGPNTVKAYAVDQAGNLSVTNSVSLDYVLSDRLVVQISGKGTVSPNHNGQLLEIGERYAMTAMATPGSGFGFTNWTGSLTTNKPTLTFVMQSNLTFTANFVDVQKPTLTISSPVLNQRWSNGVFTVKGTARDNVQVAGVWVQTNGVWGEAATGNGWTNWSIDVALVPGTNTVKACAVDLAGNPSVTNSVRFSYVVTSQLTLMTNGVGRINRSFIGNVLEVGRGYTVTAIPGAGQVFSNWVGDVTSSKAALSFLMQSNMMLTANFVPNPFVALAGSYNGLFYPADRHGGIADGFSPTNSGLFALMLTSNGMFTGKAVLQGTNRPFSGALDVNLQSQVTVPRPGSVPLTIDLQVDAPSHTLSGTVGQSPQWTSGMYGFRAASGSSNVYAGAYTMLVGGCIDYGACFGGNTNLPWGDGPAAVKVTSGGAILMSSGTLADGASISQGTTVSEEGIWPLYVSLYGGQGMLLGWMNFNTNSLVSDVCWVKPASLTNYYRDELDQSRLAMLTTYQAPPPGQNAVNWSNATVVILSAELPGGLTNQVFLTNNALQTVRGSISNLNLSITAPNGLFNGSFVHPVSGKVIPLRGAVMQVPPDNFDAGGGGWLRGPDGQGGIIRIFPE